MSSWFLSRGVLRREALRQEALRGLQDDFYTAHKAVWELFPNDPDASRDFLYRLDWRNGQAVLLVLSQREPTDQLGRWELQQKPFAPKLRQDAQYAFSLRVNPTVTRDGKRHDVVMDARKNPARYGDKPREDLIQEAGHAWLQARAPKLGFELQDLLVESYEPRQAKQHNRRQEVRSVRVTTMDLQGVLRATDPELLQQALTQGVGHAKGFGCGLLLLRPLS